MIAQMEVAPRQRRWGWYAVIFGTVAFSAYALGQAFLLLGHPGAGPSTASSFPLGFFGHLVFGVVALLAGAAQFSTSLRQRQPTLHRWLGRSYVLSACVAATLGILIAVVVGDAFYITVFAIIGSLWVATSLAGFWLARQRRFDAHRMWMTRSYAVGFSTVIFRLYAPVVIPGAIAVGYSAADGVATSAALALLTSGLGGELVLRRQKSGQTAPVSAAAG